MSKQQGAIAKIDMDKTLSTEIYKQVLLVAEKRNVAKVTILLLLDIYFREFKELQQIFLGDSSLDADEIIKLLDGKIREINIDQSKEVQECLKVLDSPMSVFQSTEPQNKLLFLNSFVSLLKLRDQFVEDFLRRAGIQRISVIEEIDGYLKKQAQSFNTSSSQSVLSNVSAKTIQIGNVSQEVKLMKTVVRNFYINSQNNAVSSIGDNEAEKIADDFIKYISAGDDDLKKRALLTFLTRCQHSKNLSKEIRDDAVYIKSRVESDSLKTLKHNQSFKRNLGFFVIGSVSGVSATLLATTIHEGSDVKLKTSVSGANLDSKETGVEVETDIDEIDFSLYLQVDDDKSTQAKVLENSGSGDDSNPNQDVEKKIGDSTLRELRLEGIGKTISTLDDVGHTLNLKCVLSSEELEKIMGGEDIPDIGVNLQDPDLSDSLDLDEISSSLSFDCEPYIDNDISDFDF